MHIVRLLCHMKLLYIAVSCVVPYRKLLKIKAYYTRGLLYIALEVSNKFVRQAFFVAEAMLVIRYYFQILEKFLKFFFIIFFHRFT